MIELKRMAHSDLEAFAGVEDFANGGMPVMGEFKVDDWDMIVVAGGNGAQVINDDGQANWKVADHQDFEFLLAVKPQMSWQQFRALVDAGVLIEL